MLQTLRSFLMTLAYQVWRATRGRPMFIHQSDTLLTFNFFSCAMVLTFFAQLLLESFEIAALTHIAFRFAPIILLCNYFCRGRDSIRSRLLLGNAFAAIAGYGLLELFFKSVIRLSSVDPTVEHQLFNLIEFGAAFALAFTIVKMIRYFRSHPRDVQAPGYNPHKKTLP